MGAAASTRYRTWHSAADSLPEATSNGDSLVIRSCANVRCDRSMAMAIHPDFAATRREAQAQFARRLHHLTEQRGLCLARLDQVGELGRPEAATPAQNVDRFQQAGLAGPIATDNQIEHWVCFQPDG